MELIGYPEFDQENDEWYLSYVDQSIESAFEIVERPPSNWATIKFAHFQSSDRPQNWASPPVFLRLARSVGFIGSYEEMKSKNLDHLCATFI